MKKKFKIIFTSIDEPKKFFEDINNKINEIKTENDKK